VLGIMVVVIGLFFLINQLAITDMNVPNSIMSTVSALIGMIPEGLVLLTSSAMAVSVLRLRKFKVLVQDLYSIENLARVDVICLDKTGTLTEGTMQVKQIIAHKNTSTEKIKEILANYTSNLDDKSPTFMALKKYCGENDTKEAVDTLAFSSERKYSGVSFKDINYYLGSPENLLKRQPENIKKYQEDYRVLVLASSKDKFKDISKLDVLGFILVQDKIKNNAKETLDYFKAQGVDIKIISGDNDKTVAKIAKQVGMSNIKSVDFSKVEDADIPKIVTEYNILGRVKPDQKKKIIKALKRQGHFVAMTGDGVNDCLALKESDCSIAMASGSDAAKNVSQFVLLESKIDNLPEILKEGRRSINNIERSSCLLLSKTIFTIVLIIAALFLKTEYFFIPIHLTLITTFTIGIPSFILALEKNHNLVKGNFLQKIFIKSFPAALTVVFNIVIIKLFEMQFGLDNALCDTLNVFLTAATGFIFLDHLCRPYNYLRACLLIILLMAFGYCSIYAYSFFNISFINKDTILVFIVLFICSLFIFDKLKMLSNYLLRRTKNI
ncbi:MAG: HAD-IC family P-type ATPase, partial [Bacilli bacterium]|nr:HAD-IC family P-type ATPase [Bacilli bacterium]